MEEQRRETREPSRRSRENSDSIEERQGRFGSILLWTLLTLLLLFFTMSQFGYDPIVKFDFLYDVDGNPEVDKWRRCQCIKRETAFFESKHEPKC